MFCGKTLVLIFEVLQCHSVNIEVIPQQQVVKNPNLVIVQECGPNG